MTTTLPKLVGEPIRRREDPRLITGHGTYVDDIKLPGMLHLAMVRSTHAHAIVKSINVAAARSAPGVVLVMTGNEVKAWGDMVPNASELPGRREARHYPLAVDRVRCATRPTIRPAITPLKVDPATIVPIMAGISGPPEINAVSPSNTPRTPPSSIANTGFFIHASWKILFNATGRVVY